METEDTDRYQSVRNFGLYIILQSVVLIELYQPLILSTFIGIPGLTFSGTNKCEDHALTLIYMGGGQICSPGSFLLQLKNGWR